MLLQFGQANWFDKAKQQPEKVKMVLEKLKSEGIASTFEAVMSRINEPLEMGYCNVGVVLEGPKNGFKKGTRVVSNGGHSTCVTVNQNLVAAIPDDVTDEEAVFVVPSSIALQGIRLIKPEIGESFVVIGLGLIGLLTAQILKANGCNVIGVDPDASKREIASSYGIKAFETAKQLLNNALIPNQAGYDGVLITASSKSNDIIKESATLCRKRGKIVLIGVVGLDIDRSDFYEKEITFQVSCSYGPGRYSKNYEELGLDYPIEFVRWTENRNFQAVLDLMSEKKIQVNKMSSSNYILEDAKKAYQELSTSNSLGIILNYQNEEIKRTIQINNNSAKTAINKPKVSFIGAGNYATRVLMPIFKKVGFDFETIASKGGVSSTLFGEKYNFKSITTDIDVVMNDKSDLVVIATRHNMHAEQACLALKNNKNVFVEKPLALTKESLKDVEKAYEESDKQLIVGFNRRFSPLIDKAKSLLETIKAPKSFIATMNAGRVPLDHWTLDKEIGGGRIVGEACHYIDLLTFLSGSPIVEIKSIYMGNESNITKDTSCITLRFKDGSIGVINYFSNGSKSYSKEKIKIFCEDKILEIDNFKQMKGYGWNNFNSKNNVAINKGQEKMISLIYESINKGKAFPIDFNELVNVSKKSIEAEDLH